MSHIVKGKVSVNFTDKDIFLIALKQLGKVHENESISIATGTDHIQSKERYDIVLENPNRSDFRIGFRWENGQYLPYYDTWGELGTWVKNVMSNVNDRYIAHHYEKKLAEEGFSVTINETNQGLEVLAEERVW